MECLNWVLRFLDRWKGWGGNSGWGTARAKPEKTKSVSLKEQCDLVKPVFMGFGQSSGDSHLNW